MSYSPSSPSRSNRAAVTKRFRISQDLPEPLWSQLQEKANREGWTLKALVVQLVEDYLDGRIAPSRKPPQSDLTLRCADGHEQALTTATRTGAAKWATDGAVPCFVCRHPIPLSQQQRDALLRWSRS
jgi:hypothetical protein